MAWIELHQSLREHKKMYACAEVLNLGKQEMIGTLVCLWLWALDNAQSGSLKGVSNRTIACVCGWPEKKAGKLVEALRDTGWLDYDPDNDCLVIHDWYDYAGKLMERRENDRKRKSKGKECGKISGGIPAESCGNSHATAPLPYPTVPNCDDGDGESAREEASDSDLFRIGLRAGEYHGIDVGVVSAVEQKAEYMTTRYANRTCSPVDCRNVFTRSFWWENGKYAFDKDAFGLLEYAFEQAEISGFSGQWRYINGILDRLSARDIHTRAEAEAFDEERPDKEGGSNGTSY